MSAALWLLWGLSLRGRVTRFVRQLRQPKYLVGFLVGVGWFLLWFGRPLIAHSFSPYRGDFESRIQEALPLVRLALALAIALWFSVAWCVPWVSAALPFREAELHVLLPAPVSRRRLIQFALLKSQVPILISALVLSLVVLGGGGLGRSLARFAAIWLLLTSWELHARWRALTLLGLSALAPRAAARRRAWIFGLLAVYWIALGAVLWPLTGSRDPESLLAAARGLSDSATLGWLLLPFLWMNGALFAEGAAAYLSSFFPALVLLALLREAVVRSNTRFEEPALEHASRQATKASPGRRYGRLSTRARLRGPFPLRATGPVEAAILWKNLLQVSRVPLATTAILGASVLLSLAVMVAAGFRPLALVFSGFGIGLAFVSPFLAGLGLRNDLRAELLHAEMVRPWPVPAERFVLAQMVAPTILGVALGLFGLALAAVGGKAVGTTTLLLGIGLVPVLVGVTGLVVALVNVGTLLFPAWSGLGIRAARGIAASGQQMVFGFALFVCLGLALLPGAALVGLAALAQWGLGIGFGPAAYPVWGLLLAAPLVVEIALLVRAGGRLWERLDPAQEILETP